MNRNARYTGLAACLLSFALVPLRVARAIEMPTGAELAEKSHWVESNLVSPAGGPEFFSFTFGGEPSAKLLPQWKRTIESKRLDDQRTEHRLAWTDAKTGLTVVCRAVEYMDFPHVEWTLRLRNAGKATAPLIADLRALDIELVRKTPEEFLLHHHLGDNASPTSYQPAETRLTPSSTQKFAPVGGRPTNGAYPYFNVEYDGGGLIAVIGWPGQWQADFLRDKESGLRIRGGQQTTHFKLLPGEEVRSPLVVLQFYKGDYLRSQNTWRRWMMAHNIPRVFGGKLPAPATSVCMGLHQSAKGEIAAIKTFLSHGVKYDFWWMDAGWYPCHDWPETGTWEPDPVRFPKGIREVADFVHAHGMKLILWFEPERVHQGTWLFENHPEWLLGRGADDHLLNLGDGDARQWLTDHIDRFITRQGIDLYRQDFNIDPLDKWRSGDGRDRQGITENHYVEGYLAHWDELRRRHPDMMIDSCSSGGRRNDLETLRRAVPLLRSDFQAPQQPKARGILVGNQGHTYGLAEWVPYYGTGVSSSDVYAARSHLTPHMGMGCSLTGTEADWEKHRRRLEDWWKVADDFYGDFYPLTPYDLSEEAWMAWQFNRPEARTGMVQAFRHGSSNVASMQLKLHDLDPAATYEVSDLDADAVATHIAGRQLMNEGLSVVMDQRPQAKLFSYRLSGNKQKLTTKDTKR